jgi:hypothetical protein
MKILLRAVITGFGLSLGAAIYKKLARELGVDEQDDKDTATRPETSGAAAPEPLRS